MTPMDNDKLAEVPMPEPDGLLDGYQAEPELGRSYAFSADTLRAYGDARAAAALAAQSGPKVPLSDEQIDDLINRLAGAVLIAEKCGGDIARKELHDARAAVRAALAAQPKPEVTADRAALAVEAKCWGREFAHALAKGSDTEATHNARGAMDATIDRLAAAPAPSQASEPGALTGAALRGMAAELEPIGRDWSEEAAAAWWKHLAAKVRGALAAAPEAPGTQDGEVLDKAIALADAFLAALPWQRGRARCALVNFLAPRLRPVAPEAPQVTLRKFDAIERAFTIASMMGASIGMGYSHRHEVEAYKAELRDHLRSVIPDDAPEAPADDEPMKPILDQIMGKVDAYARHGGPSPREFISQHLYAWEAPAQPVASAPLGGDVAKKIADERFVNYEVVQIIARALAAAQPVQGEPHGWLYDWTHSSALGKPDENYTSFTTDEAYARGPNHRNVRLVYTAPPARKRVTEAEWGYSRDEESFSGPEASREAAIAEVIEDGGWIGRVRYPREFLSPACIGDRIEASIGEMLGDEVGEAAECFGLDGEQRNALGLVVIDWIESRPGFHCWGVKDIERIEPAAGIPARVDSEGK